MTDGETFVSPEEMRDNLLRQLYDNRAELKGIALVQGIKALAALVPPPPPPDPQDGRRFSVIDQLDALPKSEGQRLLRDAITQMREDLAELEDALIYTAEPKKPEPKKPKAKKKGAK